MTHTAQKKRYPYIAVAGILGSGKTTACTLIAKELQYHLAKENEEKNVFLPLFYKDPKRWALKTQLFYLKNKAALLKNARTLLQTTGIVQDGPIYQDYHTYTKAQRILGHMRDDEFAHYETVFSTVQKQIPSPDLIIQLDASLPIIKQRIAQRDRTYERALDENYIALLARLHQEWIQTTHLPVFTLSTDTLDFTQNQHHQKKLFQHIRNALEHVGKLHIVEKIRP